MILSHQDALMAGSPYPDAYYDEICANGIGINLANSLLILTTNINYVKCFYNVDGIFLKAILHLKFLKQKMSTLF